MYSPIVLPFFLQYLTNQKFSLNKFVLQEEKVAACWKFVVLVYRYKTAKAANILTKKSQNISSS
jgi:hypothetical protein